MTKARLPDLDDTALTPEQAEIHDAICSGPRGEVVGPLRVWLRSPGLARTAQALGQHARYDSSLPLHLSELAILVTGRIWCSGFEWAHHAPIALGSGVPAEAIEAIGNGRRPTLDDQQMQAVFDCAVEVHRDRQISEETYAAGIAALGPEGMVDLVGICGYYTLISMTINVFEVPDGDGPALPPVDGPVEGWFRD